MQSSSAFQHRFLSRAELLFASALLAVLVGCGGHSREPDLPSSTTAPPPPSSDGNSLPQPQGQLDTAVSKPLPPDASSSPQPIDWRERNDSDETPFGAFANCVRKVDSAIHQGYIELRAYQDSSGGGPRQEQFRSAVGQFLAVRRELPCVATTYRAMVKDESHSTLAALERCVPTLKSRLADIEMVLPSMERNIQYELETALRDNRESNRKPAVETMIFFYDEHRGAIEAEGACLQAVYEYREHAKDHDQEETSTH